jgi:TIR domain
MSGATPNSTDHVMFVGRHPCVEELRLVLEPSLTAKPHHFGDCTYAEQYLPRLGTAALIVDLFTTPEGPRNSLDFVFRMSGQFPEIAIGLVADPKEFAANARKLAETQAERLSHFYRLHRRPTDAESLEFLHRLLTAHARLRSRRSTTPRYPYDCAVSYASEDREHARELVKRLRRMKKKVFFDDTDRSATWGAELRQELTAIYGAEARYCLVLASSAYTSKPWTKFELKMMKQRGKSQAAREFLLPVSISGATLPGFRRDVAYLPITLGYARIAAEFRNRFSSDVARRK